MTRRTPPDTHTHTHTHTDASDTDSGATRTDIGRPRRGRSRQRPAAGGRAGRPGFADRPPFTVTSGSRLYALGVALLMAAVLATAVVVTLREHPTGQASSPAAGPSPPARPRRRIRRPSRHRQSSLRSLTGTSGPARPRSRPAPAGSTRSHPGSTTSGPTAASAHHPTPRHGQREHRHGLTARAERADHAQRLQLRRRRLLLRRRGSGVARPGHHGSQHRLDHPARRLPELCRHDPGLRGTPSGRPHGVHCLRPATRRLAACRAQDTRRVAVRQDRRRRRRPPRRRPGLRRDRRRRGQGLADDLRLPLGHLASRAGCPRRLGPRRPGLRHHADPASETLRWTRHRGL